jgi:hypothetical protein
LPPLSFGELDPIAQLKLAAPLNVIERPVVMMRST